jgi:hypothetical protein
VNDGFHQKNSSFEHLIDYNEVEFFWSEPSIAVYLEAQLDDIVGVPPAAGGGNGSSQLRQDKKIKTAFENSCA